LVEETLDIATKKLVQEMSALGVSYSDQSKKQRYQLSDFNFQRTLGTGSFGRVHLVQRRADNKYVAIQVMKKSEVVRLKQVEHTMNEKAVLERIDCPFTVNLLGSFKDSQNLYFVMEYVAGGELFSLLRRSQVCSFG
jgi:protein kinase A